MKNKMWILLAMATLFAGCTDWLNVRPNSQEPASTMFNTYDGYQNALIGCYTKMKSKTLYGGALNITTIEYLAQHWDFSNTKGTAVKDFAELIKNFKYDDDNFKNDIQSIFDGLYGIVVQANTIIKAMPMTGEAAIEDEHARGVIEGEAYAIRAFCHFEVLRLFGQVPSGTIAVRLPYTENVSREAPPYYNYEEFVVKIADDLNTAIALLAEHDPIVEMNVKDIDDTYKEMDDFLRFRKLRLNYWAVKALQARYCLYVGKTAEAHAAAMEIIDASSTDKGFVLDQASLKTDFENKYFAAPTECLFVLNNHQIKDYIQTWFTGLDRSDAVLYMSPQKLADPQMFGASISASTDTRYKNLWTHEKKDQYNSIIPEIKKYDQSETDKLSTRVLMLYKQIMPMLRLAEVYLIAMETSDDLTQINSLYEQFNISRNLLPKPFASKTEAIETIHREYRCELIGEGQMFFLYKRLNAQQMLWRKEKINESDYIIPLPETEIDSKK